MEYANSYFRRVIGVMLLMALGLFFIGHFFNNIFLAAFGFGGLVGSLVAFGLTFL